MNGLGQAPATTVTSSASNPFQGSEGFTLAAIGLTLGPLLLLPGWWKVLAVAGPLYFLYGVSGIH
jgi:hypothetical protein